MNLNYIKEFLIARKDNITPNDIEELITEISSYQGTENSLNDISKVMRVINEYNISFLNKVQEYEAFPKNDIKQIPMRMEKIREILCILSMLHTYIVISLSSIKESTYNMKNIRNYMIELNEKKEHFKSEKMTWATILKSLVQETSFTIEMRKMDIEDKVGYKKYKDG